MSEILQQFNKIILMIVENWPEHVTIDVLSKVNGKTSWVTLSCKHVYACWLSEKSANQKEILPFKSQLEEV